MRWRRSNFKRLFSVLPNGNIRCHLDDYKKTSVSEAQYINPKNVAPTIIAGGGCKIIVADERRDNLQGPLLPRMGGLNSNKSKQFSTGGTENISVTILAENHNAAVVVEEEISEEEYERLQQNNEARPD